MQVHCVLLFLRSLQKAVFSEAWGPALGPLRALLSGCSEQAFLQDHPGQAWAPHSATLFVASLTDVVAYLTDSHPFLQPRSLLPFQVQVPARIQDPNLPLLVLWLPRYHQLLPGSCSRVGPFLGML